MNKEEKKKKSEEINKKKVSPEKKKIVDELVSLIEKYNTIMIVSIENMLSAHLQVIKKLLRGKAIIRVVKKNLALLAIEKCKDSKKGLEKIEKAISSNFAILFSNEDAFDISALLAEKKEKTFIKAGSLAKEDVVLEAGPTDLMAGPILSELGKIKVKAGIEQGKIAIKERSIVVKKGERVSEDVADILMKLEVKPVSVSMLPIIAFDTKSGKIYENIDINKEKVLNNIAIGSSQAFNLAVKIAYATNSTIRILLAKANSEFNSLNSKLNISANNAQSENKIEQIQT